jgi:hypothetical protein
MELSRRDLLLKSLAIGVIKLSPGMTAASTVGSWLRAESGARPATPTDQLGPFYRKGTPKSGGTPRRCGQPAIPDYLLQWPERYTTRGVR